MDKVNIYPARRVHGIIIGCDIEDVRFRTQFGFQGDHGIGRHDLGNLAVRVIDVPEDPGPSETGLHTGRLQPLVHPVVTEETFLYDLPQRVDISDVVGAGGHAVHASDTAVLVHSDDAVRAYIGCTDRTVSVTDGIGAVVAKGREELTAHIRVSAFFNDLDPGTELTQRDLVLALAGDGTTVAADAVPEINHHRITGPPLLITG